MQTEKIIHIKFYRVGLMVLYSSYQQNNFNLFLPSISAFKTLMTVVEFTKIAK